MMRVHSRSRVSFLDETQDTALSQWILLFPFPQNIQLNPHSELSWPKGARSYSLEIALLRLQAAWTTAKTRSLLSP